MPCTPQLLLLRSSWWHVFHCSSVISEVKGRRWQKGSLSYLWADSLCQFSVDPAVLNAVFNGLWCKDWRVRPFKRKCMHKHLTTWLYNMKLCSHPYHMLSMKLCITWNFHMGCMSHAWVFHTHTHTCVRSKCKLSLDHDRECGSCSNHSFPSRCSQYK